MGALAAYARRVYVDKGRASTEQSAAQAEVIGTIQVAEKQSSSNNVLGVATVATGLAWSAYQLERGNNVHQQQVDAVRSGDTARMLDIQKQEEKFSRGVGYSMSGLAGAMAGAKLGTIVMPGFGTAAGALGGAAIGAGVSWLNNTISDNRALDFARAQVAEDNMKAAYYKEQNQIYTNRR